MPLETGIAPENLSIADIDPTAIYSVTELSRHIKDALAANPKFNNLLLKGEISNFSRAASGHIYFNLREENCVIACAYFRSFQEAGCNDLGDGLQIVAMGSLNSYEPRSQYQLNIKRIIPIGDGLSALRLKRLREKLENEGLFDPERKRPLPRLPRKVGLITSKDSAAITDILTVVDSRFPNMNMVMVYATIQGEQAPSSIVRALNHLNKVSDVDAIILARGGGPSEDFMAFNDESLVRAIASSSKPVITGIGHERDICLADLAADFRAATPTAAAKAAIPDVQELRDELNDLRLRLARSYSLVLELERKDCQNLRFGLNSLRRDLDRSYNSYLMSLEIEEKESELGKKDEEIKQVLESVESGKSDLMKYKAIIAALIVLLVLVVLIFLMGRFSV
ncbi:MAG: exodeoxyribonuclease VII large subunit [Methanosaeta sp. PtaU1.Bin112]|nr:MAG: exodeoxyribonuclease VII large subunit [Methanosaeta sp. PtaU1.Bin112]